MIFLYKLDVEFQTWMTETTTLGRQGQLYWGDWDKNDHCTSTSAEM